MGKVFWKYIAWGINSVFYLICKDPLEGGLIYKQLYVQMLFILCLSMSVKQRSHPPYWTFKSHSCEYNGCEYSIGQGFLKNKAPCCSL